MRLHRPRFGAGGLIDFAGEDEVAELIANKDEQTASENRLAAFAGFLDRWGDPRSLAISRVFASCLTIRATLSVAQFGRLAARFGEPIDY